MGRVLAIGWDSADELDVRARLDAGAMPNLAALRDRGTWCSLASDDLCRAEAQWPAFSTGVEPSTSGRWTPNTFDPATYTDGARRADDITPFWSLGDEVAVVVLDVPATALADTVRGVHVVDWSAHDPAFPRCSSPPGLLSELEARFGENPARALEYAGTWNDSAWLRRYGAALVASVQLRTEVIEHLLATTTDWGLAVVVYSEPHHLAHHAWHGVAPESVLHGAPSASDARDALDVLHRALDDAIGRLADGLGPDDALVVFSPKGSEAISDLQSSTLAPELFHRLAFGEARLRQPSVRRWERRGRPPVVLPAGMVQKAALDAAAGTGWGDRLRFSGRRAASRAADAVAPGLMSKLRLRRRLHAGAASGPDPWGVPFRERPYEWYQAVSYRPWWPKMQAFVLPSFSDLHVRINVAGRERDGLVSLADYPRACAEVEQTLRACTNPRTGRTLVDAVLRPKGDDPFADAGLAADVVVSWAEDTDVLEHPDVGTVGPYPVWRVGGHDARAFAVLAGAGIESGVVAGPRVVDLSATILALARVTPRAPMDGTPFLGPDRESVLG